MPEDPLGQLIWAFISSDEAIDRAERAARAGRLGGIWLLPTQMVNAEETVVIVNRLQTASTRPLLVGVDAEAGLGLVMGGATYLPTAMAFGAAGDPDLARRAGALTAAEAHSCGINAVAAPVLDVNSNPRNPIINTRSFGESPSQVAALGTAFIEGMHEAHDQPEVLSIGKHFPGHGDTVQDSHLHLDVVNHPRSRLDAVELLPFRAAIATEVPLLMTAHVAYPALDPVPNRPATLSGPILTDVLRGELGFRGAVVTDCMNMHSVAHRYTASESTVLSVLAGCDLVLTDQWETAYDALGAALHEGRLAEARVAEAEGRVQALKVRIFGAELAKPPSIDPGQARAAVGTPAHFALAERIASAATTLVEGSLAPLSGRPLIIATRMARRFGTSVEVQLRAALAAMGWEGVEVRMVDPTPDPIQITESVEHARAAGWVVLLHFNQVASFDPHAVLVSEELITLARRVAGSGASLAIASLGSPYMLPPFAGLGALLCSYSTCTASVQALLRVLCGAAGPQGRLPVRLGAVV
jgi:beta-N-acetylhexosaminidase